MFMMVMILNYYPKKPEIMKDLERRHEILRNTHFYKSIGNSGSKKAYQVSFTVDPQINFRDNAQVSQEIVLEYILLYLNEVSVLTVLALNFLYEK